MTNEERFLSKIKKTDTCWIWLTSKTHKGYGSFFCNRKTKLAHRFSYEMYIGEIPKGMQLDHLCRVRECVNPKHLEVVTRKENILRGIGPTAINSRKTECKNGHPLIGDNVIMRGKNKDKRICVTCYKAYYKLKK